MSMRYLGAVISATPPTVTAPTGGEGGSASGAWTLQQQMRYAGNSTWPQPLLQGQLWVWGNGTNGALGLGNTNQYNSPMQVGSGTTWNKISGKYYFSFAAKSDGTLWSTGHNNQGQLGLDNVSNRSSFTQIGALTTWASIVVGSSTGQFGAAIKTDGTLWTWGRNNLGQLGLGNTSYYSSPKQVGALTNWSKISCTALSMLAIKTDGTLWSWGYNGQGRLGLGNITNYSSPKQIGSLTSWVEIGCGTSYCVAVKSDGTLWSWGENNQGQLGLSNLTNYSSPKQVGSLTDWLKISCGHTTTSAIKTDGTLWGWGDNSGGAIGNGGTVTRSSPVQVGALTDWKSISRGYENFCLSIKTNGTLWAWGVNTYGQLGNNDAGSGAAYNKSSPIQIGALTTWLKVSAGTYHSMGIKSS